MRSSSPILQPRGRSTTSCTLILSSGPGRIKGYADGLQNMFDEFRALLMAGDTSDSFGSSPGHKRSIDSETEHGKPLQKDPPISLPRCIAWTGDRRAAPRPDPRGPPHLDREEE